MEKPSIKVTSGRKSRDEKGLLNVRQIIQTKRSSSVLENVTKWHLANLSVELSTKEKIKLGALTTSHK